MLHVARIVSGSGRRYYTVIGDTLPLGNVYSVYEVSAIIFSFKQFIKCQCLLST